MDEFRIFRASDATTVTHAGDIKTTAFVPPQANLPLTIGLSVYPVGCGAPLHHHNCGEFITILGGNAELEVGGEISQLALHDTIYIPTGIDHAYRNVGAEPLRLQWTYNSSQVTRSLAGSSDIAHGLLDTAKVDDLGEAR